MVEGENRKAEEEVKTKKHRRWKSLLIATNYDAYVALNNRHNRAIFLLGIGFEACQMD